MNSYTSNSSPIAGLVRTLAPWLVALVAIFAIEVAIAAVFKPGPIERSNFLNLNPLKSETVQRAFVYERMKAFSRNDDIVIMQSGDSSGAYGIRSPVVNEYLPEGVKYINMSCCANMGYRGFYAVMDYFSARNKEMKYFVLYKSPDGIIFDYLWYDLGINLGGIESLRVFGHDIARNFTGLRSYLSIPSLGLRRQVHKAVYFWYHEQERPLINNKNYFKFLETFEQNGGWYMPDDEKINMGRYVNEPECKIPDTFVFEPTELGKVSLLEHVFSQFAELARARGIQLIIAFQPIACTYGTGMGTADIRAAIERFQKKYPEVIIPFDVIEHWDHKKFTVPAHVNWEASYETSRRLGARCATS